MLSVTADQDPLAPAWQHPNLSQASLDHSIGRVFDAQGYRRVVYVHAVPNKSISQPYRRGKNGYRYVPVKPHCTTCWKADSRNGILRTLVELRHGFHECVSREQEAR